MAVRILEAAIRKLGPFDLILCGFASDDGYTYQVAPRLAERLDLPLVSYARQISLSDGSLQADRDLEDSLQTVAVSLPALVSIAEEAFPPRRTTLMDALKAKKKPVNLWQVEADLGLSPAELEKLGSFDSSAQVGVIVHRKQTDAQGRYPAGNGRPADRCPPAGKCAERSCVIMSSNTILVFSEKPALLQELLGEARRQAAALAGQVAAVGLGKDALSAG